MLNKITKGLRLGDSLSLQDKLTVPTERTFKPETGQMIAPATIARVGIMNYRAGDCGEMFADREPNSMVKVMTTEASLFDAATLESARSAPITIGHPMDANGSIIDVDASNSKELSVGTLEGLPTRLGDELSAVVILNDAETIAIVQEKADELSIGQTCDLMLADEGAEWDAEKINIRINHVAIVEKGRAGTAKINDAVTMYDQDHVDGLQATVDVQTGKVEELTAKLNDALEQVELAKDVAFTDAVEARIELVTKARILDADVETKGKTEVEIKRAAVGKSYTGSAKLADASDAYVAVLFDMAIDDKQEDTNTSELQTILNDEANIATKPSKPVVSPQEQARQRSIKRNAGV